MPAPAADRNVALTVLHAVQATAVLVLATGFATNPTTAYSGSPV